jgi:TolA-binding protein
MRKTTPPSIPPLGDAAIDRIERGVFAALDARAVQPDAPPAPRRRLVAFAFAGAAVVGAFFGVREWRRGEALPVHAARISTGDSGSHIAIEGAVLDVAPHSSVSFGGRGGATIVVLDRGTVTCEVAPRGKRPPFVVEAGATRVTVIGTRFSVTRGGEHATVSVEHGLVEVADTNFTQLVRAGERYRPGEAVTAEPLASAPPVVAVAAPAAAAPPAAPAVAPAATVAPAPRPARQRRLALAAPVPAPAVEAPTHAVEAEHAAPEPETAAAAEAAVEAPPAAADPQRAAQRRGSVQVLFELAAQLEVRDPTAALRIYGELSAADDGWAASALFASARLEAERGQTARARELCEAYLRRFPRSPNADDARALLGTLR